MFIRTGLVVCPREENNHFLMQNYHSVYSLSPRLCQFVELQDICVICLGLKTIGGILPSVLIRGFELSMDLP